MKPEVIHLREADDPHELIHRVVERLSQGGLVALPTETVYGVAASAMHPDCIDRLRQLKEREKTKPLALALGHPESAAQIVPEMSIMAERFVRRCCRQQMD